MSLAVLESEASISICTGELTPRAMSRPKWAGMISAARAMFDVKAVSGCLSTGNGTMRNVFDPRKASIRVREAGEPSRSCIAMGRSETVSEIAVPMRMSCVQGSRSASARAILSRTSWVSSFRAWASILLIDLFLQTRRPLPRGRGSVRNSEPRVPASGFSFLHRHFAFLPGFFDDPDEDVFQREPPFSHTDDVYPVRFQLPAVFLFARRGVVFGDDVQALAEQRNAPPFVVAF